MSKSQYIFNPDTDLALADGDENYIPPYSATKMAKDLASLPRWYDIEDSRAVIPWGWNPALIKKLKAQGIAPDLLPDKEKMERIRQLSHRSLSVHLQKELLTSNEYCGSAMEFSSEQALQSFVESHTSTILKAPWSGSGKGLLFCHGEFTNPVRQWCKKILDKQKSIIGEIAYNKVKDFAMEFYADSNGTVSFAGYSAFYTDKWGAYKGNLLASNQKIIEMLTGYISLSTLSALQDKLVSLLTSHIGKHYQGYLGVDMMVCNFPEQPFYRIHPCVEINLRMNMGVVARFLYDRYVRSGSTGRFVIDYHPSEGEALQEHERMSATYPLEIREGRVYSGYLPLVPVHRRSCYRAWIWVTPDNI